MPVQSFNTTSTSLLRAQNKCVTDFDPMRGTAEHEEPQCNLARAWQVWKLNFEQCPSVENEIDDATKAGLLRKLDRQKLLAKIQMLQISKNDTYGQLVHKLKEYFQEKRNSNSLKFQYAT